MQLSTACSEILNQLAELVSHLKDNDFSKPSKTLSNSTIGQHLRHTLEFFVCLEQGFAKGIVNYDKRSHDKLIESDRFLALNSIEKIQAFIGSQKEDQPLQLEVGYNSDNEEMIIIETNFFRELTYNIEHAVHHQIGVAPDGGGEVRVVFFVEAEVAVGGVAVNGFFQAAEQLGAKRVTLRMSAQRFEQLHE